MTRLFDREPRSVLLVRARVGLGDLLCGIPALRALRARLPRAHIALLSYPEVAPVVERMGEWVDELVPFPGFPGIPERPVDHAALEGFLAAMHARRWDVALQVYGANPAANELTLRLGARATGGFFTPGRADGDLATYLPYPERRHEIDRHLDLLALLGAPAIDRRIVFPLSAADEAEAAAVRAEHGLDAPYALVHPGATSPSRRWPAERFARVADELAERGWRIAITGVPGEDGLTAAVAAAMEQPAADLCGATSLGGFAALLRGAGLLVGNDTGSAHLAAALQVPSVTVFLAGDPVRWAGLDATRHRVARVQVECNPCPHLTCPIDHRCGAAVEPAAVLAQAQEVASSSSCSRS